MEEKTISFITSVKICKGYHDFGHRIRLYIENISFHCKKCNIDFEVLIGEDVDDKNEIFLSEILSDDFLKKHNAQIIQTQQSSYKNPLKYNMLEAPNKNACMYKSKGKFICFTSGDVLMNSEFFDYIHKFQENSFYRFLTYEVKALDCDFENAKLDYVLDYCSRNILRCYNDTYLKRGKNIFDISYKSGDIMVMDRKNWIKIKGFPNNRFFHHTDTIVCCVVKNNAINIVPLFEPIKVYGLQHERIHVNSDETHQTKKDVKGNFDLDWLGSKKQFSSLTCN